VSRPQLKPQGVTVLPNNKQRFKLEWFPAPPGWQTVTNAFILADSKLDQFSGPGNTSAFATHSLYSAGGRLEWTINDNMKPASGGALAFSVFNSNQSLKFDTTIDFTSITVKDENAATLFTTGYTPTTGDLFTVYIGDLFRLAKNGIVLYSRPSTPPISFPVSYFALLTTPVAGADAGIAAPALFGDWQINPSTPVAFSLGSGNGALTLISPTEVEYSGNTIPGDHTLVAWISQANDTFQIQRATALISCPALIFLGDTTITVQPGQKIRPKTNYDAEQGAQTNLVSLAIAAGGGSLTEGEFTAPSTPGTTVIRATCSASNLQADLTVITSAVITNASNYTAAKVSEVIDFDTNIPTTTLPTFVGAGAIAEGTGNITPPLPTGLLPNDIMLMFVETANEAVSTPSGWAIVADSPQGTGTAAGATSTRLSVFWKRAAVGEVAQQITDPGDHAIGQILAFRGCILSGNPWDVTSGTTAASSTSVSIPGDTTTVVNTLVVLAVAHQTDTATPQASGYTNADLANLTERTDVATTQGNGGGFAVVTGQKATIGAYGATTATLANASVQGLISIALKPEVLSFSASIGSINSSSGSWTAPSLTGQTARITASNGVFTAVTEIRVLEVFPLTDPSAPIVVEHNKTVLIATAEDRTRTSRIKGAAFQSRDIVFRNKEVSELEQAITFWNANHPGVRFILEDKIRTKRIVAYFDSDLRWEADASCAIDITFRIVEA